ncbi:hypothetical protein HDV05_007007 [Chytridiales sp. JEL 0842]|nr:hypothetical protein HDV05_007007 [Chytridiales sp. JEL 0842]
MFLRLGLDSDNNWIQSGILSQVYRSVRYLLFSTSTKFKWPFLLFIYKLWKCLHHLFSGTSELFRICDAAVAAERGMNKKGIVSEITDTELKPVGSSVQASSGVRETPPGLVYRIDRSLLYSSKLIMERKQLESKECPLNETINSILHRKSFNKLGGLNSPQSLILRSCVTTIASSYKLMHDLNARAATKYDTSNKAHERKLLELWELAMPNEKLEKRLSDQWTKIGFQGQDPATDFRGMGVLGLDDLHYYAKNHSDSYQRVLKSSKIESSWFSMAIVGINITSFIISLVRTRQLQNFFYTYGTTKEVYEEFYCYVFDAFEKEWTSHSTPLTVMDFGRVFENFQGKIERLLLEGHPTVLDVDSPVFTMNKKAK